MIFHPDGRTLFCGFDESLKVNIFPTMQIKFSCFFYLMHI